MLPERRDDLFRSAGNAPRQIQVLDPDQPSSVC